MRLFKLLRTTSFRLTLLYVGLTGLCFLLLLGVVLWSTANFMADQIDASVASEIKELTEDSGADSQRLREIIDDLVRHAPGFLYLLKDPNGRVIAGNLASHQSVVGVHEWLEMSGDDVDKGAHIRGRGINLLGGEYLFVGSNADRIKESQEMLAIAFLWAGCLTLLVTLMGGAMTGWGVLRKIEAVSATSREIINGDLQRRVAISGNNDEFDQLAANLNGMLDRIQSLMSGVQQVSTDIAHDLRTPLTRLRQRLEFSLHGESDVDRLRDAVELAIIEVDDVLGTFSALLRIAQIESGARRAGFVDVDLAEVLKTVVEVYQPLIDERGQLLDEQIQAPLIVKGDRELLTQMFANLLENSARHTSAGTRICIIAGRHGNDIEVRCADDGPGIPEALHAKVLQRFYRLETSRTTPGNGLGLSLVAAIAALHGIGLKLEEQRPGLAVRLIFGPT